MSSQETSLAMAVVLGLSIGLNLVPASAYLFERYLVELRPSDDLSHETVKFLIVNDQDVLLYEGNYTIAAEIQNVKVSDDRGLLQHSLTSADRASTITYRYRSPLRRGDSAAISISFDISGMVGKSTFVDERGLERQDRIVNAAFLAPATIRKLEVRVDLPEGAWLARSLSEYATPTGSPIQPLDGSVGSNGTSLRVVWTREDLAGDDRFDFFIAYRFPGTVTRIPPWAIALAALFGAGMGVASTFMLARKRTVQTRTEHTLALLEEGERKVLKILLEAGGEMRQDELMKITGYSKARISQLVAHLERLKLVRKERFQRTNKLYLTGEVKEP